MHPNRTAVEEVLDMACERIDQMPGAFNSEANHVDDDVRFERTDFAAGRMGMVGLAGTPADIDDLESGCHQARNQICADMPGTADDDNASHQSSPLLG
jgi:hypothetical protein